VKFLLGGSFELCLEVSLGSLLLALPRICPSLFAVAVSCSPSVTLSFVFDASVGG